MDKRIGVEQTMDIKMKPERQPGESYDDYRERRSTWNRVIKQHLKKGKLFYDPNIYREVDGEEVVVGKASYRKREK